MGHFNSQNTYINQGNENRGCADGKSSPFQITKPYGIAYDPVSKRVFFSHGNQIDLVHSPKLGSFFFFFGESFSDKY